MSKTKQRRIRWAGAAACALALPLLALKPDTRVSAHGHAHSDPAAEAALSHWIELGRPAGNASQLQQRVDTTVVVRTIGETLEFAPTRIAVKHGTRVRIRYINQGTLPHNLVVLKQDTEIDDVAPASYGAAATGFVPVATHRERMIAWTALASPGETVEVTFVMPPPGEYTFVCLYPGHYSMMYGTLRSLN